jgi:hypothetical protein
VELCLETRLRHKQEEDDTIGVKMFTVGVIESSQHNPPIRDITPLGFSIPTFCVFGIFRLQTKNQNERQETKGAHPTHHQMGFSCLDVCPSTKGSAAGVLVVRPVSFCFHASIIERRWSKFASQLMS